VTLSAPAHVVRLMVPRIAARPRTPPSLAGRHGVRHRVFRSGRWWDWRDGVGWVLIELAAACAEWSPPVATPPADVAAYARAALEASGGEPVTETIGAREWLFTRERDGAPTVRMCLGAPSSLGELAPPPPAYVRKAHPRGMPGVRKSAQEVADRIWQDRIDPHVIQTARQVIRDAGAAEPRGYPDPKRIVAALFAEVKRRAVFVKDPIDAELMGGTAVILCLDPEGACMAGGDCDDQLIALGAMTMSVGVAVRLRVRRYRGQAQAHVTMLYDGGPRGGGPWLCIDPSVEDGVCSEAPFEEEFLLEVDRMGATHETTTFVGLGDPCGDLGDPPPPTLSAAESAAWEGELAHIRDQLDASSARLRAMRAAYAQVRADLGLPAFDTLPQGESPPPSALSYYGQRKVWTAQADQQEQKLLATTAFLSQVITEGLAGKRALWFHVGPQGPDVFVEAKPGDPFALLLLPGPNGSLVPTYVDPQGNPIGTLGIVPLVVIAIVIGVAAVSAAAAYITHEVCDYLATKHHEDALERIGEQGRQLIEHGQETPAQEAARIQALEHLAQATPPKPPESPSIFGSLTVWWAGAAALAGAVGGFFAARLLDSLFAPRRVVAPS